MFQKQQRKISFSAQKKEKKLSPKPINLVTKNLQDFSQNQRSSFDDDFINRNPAIIDDDGITVNSESLADSLDDLQSMLKEAEIEPNWYLFLSHF